MTGTIEQRLQRVEDIEAIKRLRYLYAYGANIIDGKSGDLAAFGALFAEDGIFDVGMGVATGPAEIEAMMRGLTTQWHSAMHYMINPVIDLDGDRASGTVTGLFAFGHAEPAPPVWLCNIYQDHYVRTVAGWRFQSVAIKTVFADPGFLAGYADELARGEA